MLKISGPRARGLRVPRPLAVIAVVSLLSSCSVTASSPPSASGASPLSEPSRSSPAGSTAPSASPEPSPPEPTASAVPPTSAVKLPPELAESVTSRAWFGWDGDYWAVGRYGSPAVRLPWTREESRVFASWGQVIAVRFEEAGSVFAIFDLSSGESRDVATVSGRLENLSATTNPDQTTIYFHDSSAGLDAGLRSIDVATANVASLVPAAAVDGRTERSWLLRSPSGKTVSSLLCDLENCRTDLLDTAAGEIQRLDTPFAAGAITDRYAFGTPHKSSHSSTDWAILDLTTGAVRELPSGLVTQPSGLMAVEGDRFLVDTVQVGLGRRDVVSVDAVGDDHRVLLSESAPATTAIGENQFNPVSVGLLPRSGGGQWHIDDRSADQPGTADTPHRGG